MRFVRLSRETLGYFTGRLMSIKATDKPRWGKMNPAEMLKHQRVFFQVSLGETPVQNKSTPFTRTLMKWMAFNVPLPWPPGMPNGNIELYHPKPDEFDYERRELIAAMERFVNAAEREPEKRMVSEKFGPMTLDYWRLAHGRHFDHHLRQFGV